MSENEKDKEIKKTSETELFDGYEAEGVENGEEGSGLEEMSMSEKSLSVDICQTAGNISVSESEFGGELSGDSYEERKRNLLKEKWLTVTGKRPRNIPRIQRYFDEFTEKFVFFGDRKPADVEKRRKERLLATSRKMKALGINYGKIRHEVRIPSLFNSLMSVRFHPSGEYLVTSFRKGKVQILRLSTGEQVMLVNTMESQKKLPLRTVTFLPKDTNKLYVAGETGSIQAFNFDSGELLAASEPLNVINNMDFNSDSSFLATGGTDGRVSVVDPYTFQVISDRSWPGVDETSTSKIEEEYHRLRIYGLRFHPKEINLFATAGWDNTIKIWDVRTIQAVRCMKCPLIHGDGLDISENKILTVSWQVENSINLWDFRSGSLIKTIPLKVKSTKFDGEFLYTAKFFKNDPAYNTLNSSLVALGGSGFTNVIILNIDTEAVVQYFQAFKPTLCLDILGNLIAYGGKESILRVGEVDSKRHTQNR